MSYLIILALIALIVGSFLNVVIYRLPIWIDFNYRTDCAKLLDTPEPPPTRISLWLPRSFCPVCKTTLSVISMIPILSYLIQRGKCQYCRARISPRYPLVEALSLVLALSCAHFFGFTPKLILALIFVWIMIPLFFIDLYHHILPDELTLSLLWIGLIANTQLLFCPLEDAIWGAIIGYLMLWLLVKLFYLITGKVGMGHGDFKLFAALGAWFGWILLPIMLLFSCVVGIAFGLGYLKMTDQSNHTPIAFGPFLCVTGILTLFFGNVLLRWYILEFLQNTMF